MGTRPRLGAAGRFGSVAARGQKRLPPFLSVLNAFFSAFFCAEMTESPVCCLLFNAVAGTTVAGLQGRGSLQELQPTNLGRLAAARRWPHRQMFLPAHWAPAAPTLARLAAAVAKPRGLPSAPPPPGFFQVCLHGLPGEAADRTFILGIGDD